MDLISLVSVSRRLQRIADCKSAGFEHGIDPSRLVARFFNTASMEHEFRRLFMIRTPKEFPAHVCRIGLTAC